MATLDEVRRMLDKDELDYPELARELGSSALPHLLALVNEDSPRIAPKAAYLASLLEGGMALDVIAQAAKSRHDVVRVAAAAAASNPLASQSNVKIVLDLMNDPDVGVRARAVKSAAKIGDPALRFKLNEISNVDPDTSIRSLSAEAVRDLRRP